MKIVTTIEAYEVDGKEYKIGEERDCIKIHAHHIRDEFVIIEMPSGDSYTVKASQLRRAIVNAIHWRQ